MGNSVNTVVLNDMDIYYTDSPTTQSPDESNNTDGIREKKKFLNYMGRTVKAATAVAQLWCIIGFWVCITTDLKNMIATCLFGSHSDRDDIINLKNVDSSCVFQCIITPLTHIANFGSMVFCAPIQLCGCCFTEQCKDSFLNLFSVYIRETCFKLRCVRV